MRGMLVLIALAVTACGGGGGSSGGNTGSAGGGQVPPPAPTPTPTPTSPSYLSARDFTQDRIADDFGARIERFSAYGSPGTPTRVVSQETTTTLGAIGFTYRANPKSYRATYLSEVQDFTRIQPLDVGSASFTGDQDYNPADPSPLRRYFRMVQYNDRDPFKNMEYVGSVSWSDVTIGPEQSAGSGPLGEREISRLHLYGARTITTDLPTTSSATYRPTLGVLLTDGVDVTVNWTTGEISGTARAACPAGETCPGGDLGEVSLVGRFDGSLRILGTIGGSAGYSGTFVGGFYGPRAIELGIVGDFRHPTRRSDIFVSTVRRRN